MSDFAHLHSHSDNSPLDGMTSTAQMVQEAIADGQKATAVTDHGNLAGWFGLAKSAREARDQGHDIKALGGMEIYLAVGSREDTDRFVSTEVVDGEKAKPYFHLTVLAINQVGVRNLVRCNNDAMHHVLSKPRMDYDLLKANGEGLVLGTGCLGGPVQQNLINGDEKAARWHIEQMLEVVGGNRDRLFIEVMDHGIPIERKIQPQLMELAKFYGLRVVATNDAHYPYENSHDDHDRLLAIQVNKPFDEPDRFRFTGHGFWQKTGAAMRTTFDDLSKSIGQDVVANAGLIGDMAEGCLSEFLPKPRMRLPQLSVPQWAKDAFDAGEVGAASCASDRQYWLYRLILDGAVDRYGADLSGVVRERLRFEFDVITYFGFEDYFLMVWDFVTWCRKEGITLGPGRGSAAGSAMAYCLRITDIEPLSNDLLFERFLDVYRKGFPDVDLDLPKWAEHKAMEFFIGRYGHSHVARIGNYGTLATRAILGDMARLDRKPTLGEQLKKTLPAQATGLTLRQLMDPDAVENEKKRESAERIGVELRRLTASNPDAATVVQRAAPLENTRGRPGIHACGIVVSDEPLTDLVPMRIDAKTGNQVTLWSAPELEALGFVKMDALTIDNLDVVAATVKSVWDATGEKIDTSYGKLPMDPSDPRAAKAWDVICSGDTAGLFQIEGGGITKVAMNVHPQSLSDLSAVVALYRPGPLGAGMHDRFANRKNGREEATYDYLTSDPDEAAELAKVLSKSYGVIVVQEDLMNLSGVVAGFGPGKRNRLRKAFSKKIPEEMAALEKVFMDGAVIETVDDDSAEVDTIASRPFAASTAANLWKTFAASAEYLFNACVTGDTQVRLFTGDYTTVADLYEASEDNLDAGRSLALGIQAYDESRARFDYQQVSYVHDQGVQRCYRFVTDGGQEATSTADHRWLTTRGYLRVDEFVEGSTVLVTTYGDQRVASVHDVGMQQTYDVQMAEGTDHNFVANGIVSHNSHSAPYAYLAYIEAYLKANYPAHFGAALLSVKTNKEARINAMASSRRSGVRILPPDVNRSGMKTAVVDGTTIRLGLSEIRSVKSNAQAVIAERERGGDFVSLADLVNRVKETDKDGKPKNVSLAMVETLIDCGACDCFGQPRRGMVAAVRALRDSDEVRTVDAEYGKLETAARERRALGLVMSQHPVALVREQFPDFETTTVSNLAPDFNLVALNVVVAHCEPKRGRNNKLRAHLVLEDDTGAIDGIMWSNSLDAFHAEHGRHPAEGDVLQVRAKVKTMLMAAPTDDESGDDSQANERLELVVEDLKLFDYAKMDFPADPAPIEFVSVFGEDPDPEPEVEPEPDDPDPEPEAPRGSFLVPSTAWITARASLGRFLATLPESIDREQARERIKAAGMQDDRVSVGGYILIRDDSVVNSA